MFGAIVSLFGRSPFAPLQSHMERVTKCVHLLVDLFEALEKEQRDDIQLISAEIAEFEHQADITKNDIRNHLPKSLFLPIDRSHLLEILSIQDKIADKAEDVAVLLCLKTLKPLKLLPSFKNEFKEFLKKNIATFDGVQEIVKEMHELLEASFGGIEAEKVCSMVEKVSFQEHEVDLVQRLLLEKLFQEENELSFVNFHLWQKMIEAIGDISNLSESLALRIRMTLELK